METNDNYRPMINFLITTIAAVLLVGWGGVEVTKPRAALSPMKSPSASRGRPATSHRLPTTLPCTAVAPSAAPEKPSPHSLPHDEYCSFG